MTDEYLENFLTSVHLKPNISLALKNFPENSSDEEKVKWMEARTAGELVSADELLVNVARQGFVQGVAMTSFMISQLDFIKKGIIKGGKMWRYIQGVSGMGKTVALKMCARYVQYKGVFLIYLAEPSAIQMSLTRRFLKNLRDYNSEDVWKKYVGDDKAYDLAKNWTKNELHNTQDDLLNYVMGKLLDSKSEKPIVCICDNFHDLVNTLLKTRSKPEARAEMLISLVLETTSTTPNYTVLVAASQHHSYDSILSKEELTRKFEAVVPQDPMDIVAVKRALARFVPQGEEGGLDRANEALKLSGLIMRPAKEAMEAVYSNAGEGVFVGTPHIAAVMQNKIVAEFKGKIKKHLEINPINDSTLITEYVSNWINENFHLDELKFEPLLDRGVITRDVHSGTLRYVNRLAETLHLLELCAVDKTKTISVAVDKHDDFEKIIVKRLVALGLKLNGAVLGSTEFVVTRQDIPVPDALVHLEHKVIKNKPYTFDLIMTSNSQALLRQVFTGPGQACLGLLVSTKFPAFDFFLVYRKTDTEVDLFGIQISSEKATSSKRFNHSKEVFEKMLAIVNENVPATIDPQNVPINLEKGEKVIDEMDTEDEKGETGEKVSAIEVTKDGVGVPTAVVKAKEPIRGSLVESKVRLYRVYIGLAKIPAKFANVNSHAMCTFFLVGKENIEKNFAVQLT